MVTAGSQVIILEHGDPFLVYSIKHKNACYLSKNAFVEPGYIHPSDLANTMRWETLVNRWLPLFPDTLTTELVLSVIYKETGGNPHATDQTGNDVRLVGYASVGLMGAIARPNLPCYDTLTAPSGKDAYSCQIYLGMWILDWSIRRAHFLRETASEYPISADITLADVSLGLQLYGCTEENVLADNCLAWGGSAYSDKVLHVIMPEILKALALSP